MEKISISNGNSKMGAVPSVSLPPIVTCAPGCPCAAKCYAAKLCRLRPNVRNAYARNLRVYESDPAGFERQVEAAAMVTRFFRWHVSGDILNMDYLKMMVRIARRNPGTEFLAFTKRYDLVHDFMCCEDLPVNLHLILSAWPGLKMDNYFNLPEAHVVFKGEEPAPDWKVCGGNCTACACRGLGCWTLKPGEKICFSEH